MTTPVIEIRNLSYTYPDGTKALFDISLDIFKGSSLGIIGSNGAGKSTLLLHLNGVLRTNGHVKILGCEISEKNLSLVRTKVGLVFQDPDNQLFMPTVSDDVGFGPINMGLKKHEVDASVHKALNEVDMLSFVKRSPHHLSLGEKKRVAIATVLSMEPDILVLDEPSSNLDPKHRRGLIDLLKKLPQTKIIATHDLELVLENCTKVILLDQGKLIASGDTREILSNKDLLEAHNLELPASLS